MSDLTAEQFVKSWANVSLNERQIAQRHFMDVCRLVDFPPPPPDGIAPDGNRFVFEHALKKDTGGQGYADVWYEGHFAIEYKAPGKDLDAAYRQLQQYRENLNNPPLLVVCDIKNWEIHTNFPNTEKRVHKIQHDELIYPSKLNLIRALFTAPDSLNPRRNTEDVTKDAAKSFELVANEMRGWETDPERIAHFLTKLVFCLFAEDVSLLPAGPGGEVGIFSEILERTRTQPSQFIQYTHDLFTAMADGGHVLFREIPWFNGSLFEDVRVEELSLEALTALESASRLNWASVEPAIFGTLFERSLDPRKRAQLGAHYTSRDDILLIVEPVLMQPLRREWDAIKAEAAPARDRFDAADTPRARNTYQKQLEALREKMLNRLRTIKVLDPACGSGNFLYVSLGLLLDMEKEVMNDPLWEGLTRPMPEVHPRQMYGIEINEIAHALASIVVWIGYIQWRQNNGYVAFAQPILEDLHNNIRQMDAILAFDENGNPVEPDWEAVDVIVSNPPFLGGRKHREELSDKYVENIWQLYNNRVARSADLVCYWFERARIELDMGNATRAGLLATSSIRDGASREVLNRIKESGDIFFAWSDRDWILDGAAVRVSMIGFSNNVEEISYLDGKPVPIINSDLTSGIDLSKAKRLVENKKLCWRGDEKHGAFDIDEKLAQKMLAAPNISGRSNWDVIRPYINAIDVVRRSRNMWVIDFFEMSLEEAELYEMPIEHVRRYVKPERDRNKRKSRQERWWQHGEIIPGMRRAIEKVDRFIVTPEVSKHRIFAWIDQDIVPDHKLHSITRNDDYFFGILHSKIHEVWSLRMGSWHGKGNDPRYTPTTTFETFPFPWSPGQEPVDHPAYQSIAAAAKQLHEERDAWLNPPGMKGKALQKRTLTNLYNALNVFRGLESIKITPEAGDFAPRLDELHRALDAAVCAAYGWDVSILDDEESILRELLALNLERAEN